MKAFINDWFTFIKGKFDNLSLWWLIVLLLACLMWADKHSNNDFVKWLEEFTAGIGGAYLGLIQARSHLTNGTNGNGSNGTISGASTSSASSASDPKSSTAVDTKGGK